MAITRQIKNSDDLALVRIVLDFTRGDSIEGITLRLKEQCTKFDIDCKTRYQAIKEINGNHEYKKHVNSILDALSIGGTQLHLMTVNEAKKKKLINCYIWDRDRQTLTYLQSGKSDKTIPLKDNAPLIRAINALTLQNKSKTVHLFAKQVETLITNNADPVHIPHTTSPDLILQYESSYNIYDLLKLLHNKHPRLSVLIDKIDQIRPQRSWWMYLMVAAGLTASTGIAFYLKENFAIIASWYERTLPIVSRFFHNTIYLLRKTPLIGVLSNGLPMINSWYQSILDGSITDSNKLVKLLFNTVERILPIIGYVLCYLAAGAMTVPAVAMFITGSIIDVVETLYTLLHHELVRYFNPLAPATEYYSASAKTCADNRHERNVRIFYVKLIANLLTTASVVIWCVFPPSLMIALTCVTFTWLVSLTKNSLISNLKNSYANALQSDLKDICDQFNPPRFSELELENLELKQQNLQQEQTIVRLTTEINAIKEIRETDRSNWMSFFGNRAPDNIADANNTAALTMGGVAGQDHECLVVNRII